MLRTGVLIAAVVIGVDAKSAVRAPNDVDISARLCEFEAATGTNVTLVGRHLYWSRISVARANVAATDVADVMRRQPPLVLAANGRWVAWSPLGSASVTIVDCRASAPPTPITVTGPIDRIAVSQTGDLAVHVPGRTVLIMGSRRTAEADTSRMNPEVPDLGTDVDLMFWTDDRLTISSGSTVRDIDPLGTGYKSSVRSAQEAAGDHLLFSYNGLVYSRSTDGCIDILTRDKYADRIRRVSCPPSMPLDTEMLAVDATSMTLLDATDGVRWTIPRPTVYSARISGTTREIANGLRGLLASPVAASIPLGANTGGRIPPSDSASRANAWGTFFKSAGEIEPTFELAIQDMTKKGWIEPTDTARAKEAWGATLSWRPAAELIRPARSDLATIASLHYSTPADDERVGAKGYTDFQILNLFRANRSLGRTLGGALFLSGWIPLGIPFNRDSGLPLAFSPLDALRFEKSKKLETPETTPFQASQLERALTALRFTRDCRPSGDSPTGPLVDMLKIGFPIQGRIEDAIESALGEPTEIHMKADAAEILTCSAVGVPPVRLLMARSVKLQARKGPLPANFYQAVVVGNGGVRYRHDDDAEWPVTVDKSVAVAVATADELQNTTTAYFARRWLDSVFVNTDDLGPILFPATVLNVTFAAAALRDEAPPGIPHVTLLSWEVTPNAARGDACDAHAATLHRQALDALIGLNTAERSKRVVDQLRIAVAENGINRMHPVFVRDDGCSIWQEFDQTSQLVNLCDPLADSSVSPSLIDHGMEVSGIIAAQKVLLGVLAGADLVWLKLTGEPPNESLLNALFVGGAIVNVSGALPTEWNLLSSKFTGIWSENLLLVGAVNNTATEGIGAPLSWRPTRNVLGVGVARADGELKAETPFYTPDYVDLIAPGDAIPAIRGAGDIKCVTGTSYATAYVSAVAALVANAMALPRPATASQIKARLLATAQWRSTYDQHVNAGLVDARRAFDGVAENLLWMKRGDNSIAELTLTTNSQNRTGLVHIFGVRYDGTSVDKQAPFDDTVAWENVIRIQRLPTVAQGRQEQYLRVSFVDHNSRFVIVDHATLLMPNRSPAIMPVSSCRDRTAPNATPPTCQLISMDAIQDYIAPVRVKVLNF